MAVWINRNDYTQDILKNIVKDLTVICKSNFYKAGARPSPGKVIHFYSPTKDKDYVKVPFYYGNIITQKLPNRKLPKTKFNMKISWRSGQKSIYLDIMKQLKKYRTSNLTVMCATGKTVIAAAASYSLKLITLILVSTESLEDQWKNTFTRFTNADAYIVPKRALKKFNTKADVYICLNKRYRFIPDEVLDNIGFVIVDEAHLFCSKNYVNSLLCCRPLYILIETATRKRTDDATKMLDLYAGTHEVTREVKINFDLYKVETGICTDVESSKWIEMCKDVHLNPERIKIIAELIYDLKDNNKILVVCFLKQAVDNLLEALLEKNIDCDKFYGSDKCYNDSNVLIATIKKAGTGFDPTSFTGNVNVENFNVLILACSNVDYIPIVQVLGRALRGENPSVYMIVDCQKSIYNHWLATSRIAKKMGATIKDYEL